MPNHITNILRVTAYKHLGAKPERIDELVEAIKSSDSPFDFNRLILMPSSLDIVSGSLSSAAHALVDDGKARREMALLGSHHSAKTLAEFRQWLRGRYPKDDLDLLARKVQHNIGNHGAVSWYEWCIEHWGTKWNAYSVTVARTRPDGDLFLHFETAWAPPMPVLDKLASQFPDLHFRLMWIDEGDDRAHRVYWEKGKRDSDEAVAA